MQDDASAAASYLDAIAKAEEARHGARGSLFFGVPDPTGGEGTAYPPSEGSVMDTTFYYALYLVLFVGTIVGNFFLVSIFAAMSCFHFAYIVERGRVTMT